MNMLLRWLKCFSITVQSRNNTPVKESADFSAFSHEETEVLREKATGSQGTESRTAQGQRASNFPECHLELSFPGDFQNDFLLQKRKKKNFFLSKNTFQSLRSTSSRSPPLSFNLFISQDSIFTF